MPPGERRESITSYVSPIARTDYLDYRDLGAGRRKTEVEIKILGAHNLASRNTNHTCFLIDGVVALDAGSLASALSTEEQTRVEAMLLTHRHFDHIRDIPTLGLATLDEPRQIGLYSLQETLDAVHDLLLNGDVYPDLTKPMNGAPPKYGLHPIEPEVPFRVSDFQVKPISVPHPVPCVGYMVQSDDGGRMAYTGDLGGGLSPFLDESFGLQVIFVDVTLPNRLIELARLTGHLTPCLLREQLLSVSPLQLSSLRLVAVHISANRRDEVVDELAVLAEELGVDLTPGYEGMLVQVSDSLVTCSGGFRPVLGTSCLEGEAQGGKLLVTQVGTISGDTWDVPQFRTEGVAQHVAS